VVVILRFRHPEANGVREVACLQPERGFEFVRLGGSDLALHPVVIAPAPRLVFLSWAPVLEVEVR
jgi:hypothetical protein